MNLVRKLVLERKGKRPPFMKAPLNAPGGSLRDQLDDKVTSFAFGIMAGPAGLIMAMAVWALGLFGYLREAVNYERRFEMFGWAIWVRCWWGRNWNGRGRWAVASIMM